MNYSNFTGKKCTVGFINPICLDNKKWKLKGETGYNVITVTGEVIDGLEGGILIKDEDNHEYIINHKLILLVEVESSKDQVSL